MKSLIIGMGEVGKALYKVLEPHYEVVTKDVDDWDGGAPPENVEFMHVCLNYTENWMDLVLKYVDVIRPLYINVQSTVPPGTTAQLQASVGIPCAHSTTRGLHPNLYESMKTFKKHIGGDIEAANFLFTYFQNVGIECFIDNTAKTTELAHIMSNALYGINLMFHDEMNKLCRLYGVDYHSAVTLYNWTANDGYIKLGHDSKMKMLLTPPGGKIGGHCVVYGANLIPEGKRGPMMDALAKYNDSDK